MDQVNPWLDPSEVRHLAEQLLRPVAPARLAAADPGFDKAFVGFTNPNRQSVETLPPEEEATPTPPLYQQHHRKLRQRKSHRASSSPTSRNQPQAHLSRNPPSEPSPTYLNQSGKRNKHSPRHRPNQLRPRPVS